MRRRLPLAAFLVSRLLNHSRFPDGRAHGFAAPLRVALGLRPKCPQGTRFPSRLWTLETLARSGGGGGPHPWRERWARGRAYRGGSGRMQRGLCRLGQEAWPGGDSCGVRGDAFLASRLLNHSRFPAGRAHGFAAPLRVALGLRPKCPQGTRFPSRLWTLETLARSGGGGGPHPWRERWARGRAYRGGSGRMQRGFCRLGQGAWPGGDSRRVRGDAFLAPFRRSQRSRRLRSPQRRPMPQRAVKGQGPFDISERRPSPYRAQRGRPLMAAARAKQHISERRPREYRAQRGRPLTAAARAKQLFFRKNG